MANIWIEYDGSRAWQQHGVTGESKNPHRRGTAEWTDWLNGFSDAMSGARHAALADAAAYHALSVRDNAKDREWADKLAGRLV